MLQFRVRVFGGDTALATLRGRLVLGPETDSFRLLAGALMSEYHRVIFDVGKLRTIDCAGLGELVRCAARAERSGTEVGLLRLTRGIRDLMVITRLATLFDCIDERPQRAA